MFSNASARSTMNVAAPLRGGPASVALTSTEKGLTSVAHPARPAASHRNRLLQLSTTVTPSAPRHPASAGTGANGLSLAKKFRDHTEDRQQPAFELTSSQAKCECRLLDLLANSPIAPIIVAARACNTYHRGTSRVTAMPSWRWEA